MKILIDLTALADNFSGIERYAASISYYMIKQTEDQFVLLFKNFIHPIFDEFENNTRVKFITIPSCNKLLFNQVSLLLAVLKQKADWYLFMAFPVPVLLFKKNMISTIHDICCWDCPETMNGMSKWYFRISHQIAMMKCRNIITISEFSKKRIEEKFNYLSEKIWLIYCGIDKKFLDYKECKSNNECIRSKYNLPEKYILSLSTLEPRKNLKLLINAYVRLIIDKSIDIPLVLAGRKGWKMDELLSGISDKIVKKILFTGFIDDDDLPAVYGNAQLFVFPSMYEGFGIPPLEALACGTAVVSSDAASLPEVLGDAAVYFKSQDEMGLINSIIYAQKCDIVDEMREKRIKRKEMYLWDKEAKKLYSFLRENL